MDPPDNARKQSEKNVIKLRAYALLTGVLLIIFIKRLSSYCFRVFFGLLKHQH